MRGEDKVQRSLFSYSQVDDFVPPDHPIRRIRALTDAALERMAGSLGHGYSHKGRSSIAPERLIRALLLQMLFSIRSERRLIEELRYNMLYRWFVGLSLDDAVWDASTFSKNRQRFIDSAWAGELLMGVVAEADLQRLLSNEHFSVDGTLIQAWASMGSYRRRDDDSDPPPGPPDFRGESRKCETHECKTDPDARLYRKSDGQAAQLCYLGHILLDNRHGLVVDTRVTPAHGTAEVDAALEMLDRRPGRHRLTVGADKGYDRQSFVSGARKAQVTPHVCQRKHSRIDARTTRHAGYAKSVNARHRVEAPFAWGKFARPLRKTMLRGLERVQSQVELVFAAYNLVRLSRLVPA